ncbi:hypothetical protein HDU96_002737 [Phlyctochytrium bullatum]|nr:hypothetical protein HDU96_002737 [Phlyctochytrium bullatum]
MQERGDRPLAGPASLGGPGGGIGDGAGGGGRAGGPTQRRGSRRQGGRQRNRNAKRGPSDDAPVPWNLGQTMLELAARHLMNAENHTMSFDALTQLVRADYLRSVEEGKNPKQVLLDSLDVAESMSERSSSPSPERKGEIAGGSAVPNGSKNGGALLSAAADAEDERTLHPDDQEVPDARGKATWNGDPNDFGPNGQRRLNVESFLDNVHLRRVIANCIRPVAIENGGLTEYYTLNAIEDKKRKGYPWIAHAAKATPDAISAAQIIPPFVQLTTPKSITTAMLNPKEFNKPLDEVVKDLNKLIEQRRNAVNLQRKAVEDQIQKQRQAAKMARMQVLDLKLPPPVTLSHDYISVLGRSAASLLSVMQQPHGFLQHRYAFLDRVQKIISNAFPNEGVKAHLFGSSVTGLGTSGSDVDVTLEIPGTKNPDKHPAANMHNLSRILKRAGMEKVLAIPYARVPICKFYDPKHRVSRRKKENPPAAQDIKTTGASAHAPGASEQGLEGFESTEDLEDETERPLSETKGYDNMSAMVTWDISFVDSLTHPALRDYPRPLAQGSAIEASVVSLFYGFMRYYGWDYKYRPDRVVSIREGTVLDYLPVPLVRDKIPEMALVVEDPFQVPQVLNEIRRAARMLSDSWSEYSDKRDPQIIESTWRALFEKPSTFKPDDYHSKPQAGHSGERGSTSSTSSAINSSGNIRAASAPVSHVSNKMSQEAPKHTKNQKNVTSPETVTSTGTEKKLEGRPDSDGRKSSGGRQRSSSQSQQQPPKTSNGTSIDQQTFTVGSEGIKVVVARHAKSTPNLKNHFGDGNFADGGASGASFTKEIGSAPKQSDEGSGRARKRGYGKNSKQKADVNAPLGFPVPGTIPHPAEGLRD